MTIEPTRHTDNDKEERTVGAFRDGSIPFVLEGPSESESTSGSGRVLIISEDSMVRNFLGEMARLHGYDSQYCREWRTRDLEHSWKDYDAIFLDSHFMRRLRNLDMYTEPNASERPMVVILGSELNDCVFGKQETGLIRTLRKPLDYRQMGAIMDECVQLNSQKPGSPDPDAGCV